MCVDVGEDSGSRGLEERKDAEDMSLTEFASLSETGLLWEHMGTAVGMGPENPPLRGGAGMLLRAENPLWNWVVG